MNECCFPSSEELLISREDEKRVANALLNLRRCVAKLQPLHKDIIKYYDLHGECATRVAKRLRCYGRFRRASTVLKIRTKALHTLSRLMPNPFT